MIKYAVLGVAGLAAITGFIGVLPGPWQDWIIMCSAGLAFICMSTVACWLVEAAIGGDWLSEGAEWVSQGMMSVFCVATIIMVLVGELPI